ncbi:MAG: hypothetical protein SNJ29_15570 [Rikenellaceae bacterium]
MLDILCCKITIGDADTSNPMKINNPITLTEVGSIEISESYKQLIGTATIMFPKGTVFKSTIIGNATIEGADASSITTEIMEDGVIIEKRTTTQAMNETSFSVGQRVNIQLGYNGVLKNLFFGYITAYNSESQFEIKCENMAYKLKLKQAPKFETSTTCSVNDILGEKYNLLKDTGFAIHTDTKQYDIKIGKVKITDNFTVADILNEWSKYKLYCFLKYDENNTDSMPAIAIGRPYSSSKSQPIFPQDSEATPFKIKFDYHVASSDLKAIKVDPKFLAITGKALGEDEKFFEATVRLNPDYDSSVEGSKEFQTVNATQITTKSQKVTGNQTAEGAETKTQVDLSTYTVMPYMSPNIGINSDTLVEETIEYFKNYNLNGIEGSLTIFGDLALNTACQVELIDTRNPSKNGVYIVEEVTTTFGTSGYRQKVSIPHKVRK